MTKLGTGAIAPDGTLDFAWCDDDGAVFGVYSAFTSEATLRADLAREGFADVEIIITSEQDGDQYFDVIISADLPALKLSVLNAGRVWSAAKDDERAAMATLYAAVVAAHAAGVSEVEAARLAGVDRMTVRRALGKL